MVGDTITLRRKRDGFEKHGAVVREYVEDLYREAQVTSDGSLFLWRGGNIWTDFLRCEEWVEIKE